MKRNVGKILSLLLFLVSSATFADGGGSVDSSGDGAFVKTAGSAALTYWDLFAQSPGFRDDFGEIHMMPMLSPEGFAARGEWFDYRRLDGADLLEQRLQLWSQRAPNLTALLRADAASRGLPLILTTLEIRKSPGALAAQIAIASGATLEAGAYFDPETGRTYADIEVVNLAGARSQAAMLLRARLRGIQLRFGLSDSEAGKLVYEIVMLQPDPASRLDDSRFAASHERANAVPQGWATKHAPGPAAKEIQEAVDQGVLGEKPRPPPKRFCPPGSFTCPVDGGSDTGDSGG